MSAILAIVFASLAYLIIRVLHLTANSCAPFLFVKDQSSQFVQSVLDLCPILHQTYVPPLLWGKSGHVQTIAYAKMGRVHTTIPSGVRHSKVMPDGATLLFDIYEPHTPHKSGGEYCILICPGIGSSSESAYIHTLVDSAQKNGFISVVLNHLGALKSATLTSPRIFTYGGTEELKAVRSEVERLHPGCGLILLGCSMGGNIVIKYLGENRENQGGVLAAISVCTGYSVLKAMPLMLSWKNLARGYLYVITANQKRILKRHRDKLLSDDQKKLHGIDENQIFSSRFLTDLDETYTRRRYGFNSLNEYYDNSSAHHYLHNVKIPLLLVNAEDDPIVPVPLLDFAKEAVHKLPNCMFVLTKHGGHLGYFEKGLVYPEQVTWMDRLIVEFSTAVSIMHQQGKLPILPSCGEDKPSLDSGPEEAEAEGKRDHLPRTHGDRHIKIVKNGDSVPVPHQDKMNGDGCHSENTHLSS